LIEEKKITGRANHPVLRDWNYPLPGYNGVFFVLSNYFFAIQQFSLTFGLKIVIKYYSGV